MDRLVLEYHAIAILEYSEYHVVPWYVYHGTFWYVSWSMVQGLYELSTKLAMP